MPLDHPSSALITKTPEVTDKVTNLRNVDNADLNQPKRYIHYDEFTKHFDSNHIKIPLRR
jgi:hypothetical protein